VYSIGKNKPQNTILANNSSLKVWDKLYDAQIGRFLGIDPADQFPSGYTGMGNNPANMIDPSGMLAGTHWYAPTVYGFPSPFNQNCRADPFNPYHLSVPQK
jgi:RHS repeat-associated protein